MSRLNLGLTKTYSYLFMTLAMVAYQLGRPREANRRRAPARGVFTHLAPVLISKRRLNLSSAAAIPKACTPYCNSSVLRTAREIHDPRHP